MASDLVLELTDGNFNAEVVKSDLPVLVDFWATWCGPCRMIAPLIDELAVEYEGRMRFGKVDTDKNQQQASALGVSSIPALFIFKNGEVVDRIVGALPKSKLKARIEPHV